MAEYQQPRVTRASHQQFAPTPCDARDFAPSASPNVLSRQFGSALLRPTNDIEPYTFRAIDRDDWTYGSLVMRHN